MIIEQGIMKEFLIFIGSLLDPNFEKRRLENEKILNKTSEQRIREAWEEVGESLNKILPKK